MNLARGKILRGLLCLTMLLLFAVTANAASSVKLGKYANNAVFRGEFSWHIILKADKTFELLTGDFEGIYTLTGTWTDDSSGKVTAKIANGETITFTGGGSDVLTLTVWPYGSAFNNTPLYYDASYSANNAPGSAREDSGASLTLDKNVYAPGEIITVTTKDVPQAMVNKQAFVAIYSGGARHEAYQEYHYPKAGNGVLMFKAPALAGNYEMRLYRMDNVYTDKTFVLKKDFTVIKSR